MKENQVDGIKVKIDAEDINAYLTQAVIESALGKYVKEAVERACNSSYSVGDWVQQAIKEAAWKAAAAMLETEPYRAMLEDAVRRTVTQEVIDRAAQTILKY